MVLTSNKNHTVYLRNVDFLQIRRAIANAVDEDLGLIYLDLLYCRSDAEQEENLKTRDEIIEEKGLNAEYKDVIEFLYKPDMDDGISCETCRKVYGLLDDKYPEFNDLVKECADENMALEW